MAKNSKQRQKTIEKKRAKRQGRGRSGSSKSPSSQGLLGQPFLARCWDQEPLAAPPGLVGEVEKFDALAEALLTQPLAENGVLAARFDLIHVISDSLHQIFPESVLKDVMGWLYRHAQTPPEQQRVLATLQALDKTPWSPYNPILHFLLTSWFGQLPASLSRWLGLWLDPLKTGPWPEISLESVARLAEADGIAVPEVGNAIVGNRDLFAISDIYELLMAMGAVYGWTAGPADFCEKLAAHVLWQWSSQRENGPLAAKLREQAPELHSRWALFQLASLLGEASPGLVGTNWDDFVMDPQGPSWVLELADDLKLDGSLPDAYQLLTKMAVRIPELVEVHEMLAELALQMEMPAAQVAEHIAEGLEALEEQGEAMDAALVKEYRQSFLELSARSTQAHSSLNANLAGHESTELHS